MQLLTFVKATVVPVSADELFDWHEAAGAFERLTPPWERVRILGRQGGIRDGATVSLEVGPWPFSMRSNILLKMGRPGALALNDSLSTSTISKSRPAKARSSSFRWESIERIWRSSDSDDLRQ